LGRTWVNLCRITSHKSEYKGDFNVKRSLGIFLLALILLLSGLVFCINGGGQGLVLAEAEEEAEIEKEAAAPGLEEGESWAKEWKEAGLYGPSEGLAVIDGKASVMAGNVELQNTVIKGNLYIQAGAGGASVTLNNVTVTGELHVWGGGRITIRDGQVNYLEINNPANATTVIAEGSASVWSLRVKSESLLEEKTGTEAEGFGHVYSTTKETVTISGNLPTLTVENEGGAVNYLSGRIGKVYIESPAGNSVLTLGEQTEIDVLELVSKVRIKGSGTVNLAIVLADGCEMDMDAKAYQFAEGTSIIAGGGLADESGKHVVTLQPIEDLSLQPGGTGTRKVVVDPADAELSVASSNPNVATVTLADGTITVKAAATGTAAITVTASKENHSPASTTFTVSVNLPGISLSNLSNVTVEKGSSAAKTVTVKPGDAVLKVLSSNSSVAKVSLSGQQITIEAVGYGTSKITVTAEKSGYATAKRTFTVTVPNPLKSIEIVENSPLIGSVGIRIHLNNPSNYNVYLDGIAVHLKKEGYFEYSEIIGEQKYTKMTVEQLRSLIKITKK